MDTKYIGRRIKVARERKGLTQEQLAEMVDLSPMHMSVLERGVKPPKLETLIRIANALDVTADILLQDLLDNHLDAVDSEARRLISQLSSEDQLRVLEALKGFVEASNN